MQPSAKICKQISELLSSQVLDGDEADNAYKISVEHWMHNLRRARTQL